MHDVRLPCAATESASEIRGLCAFPPGEPRPETPAPTRPPVCALRDWRRAGPQEPAVRPVRESLADPRRGPRPETCERTALERGRGARPRSRYSHAALAVGADPTGVRRPAPPVRAAPATAAGQRNALTTTAPPRGTPSVSFAETDAVRTRLDEEQPSISDLPRARPLTRCRSRNALRSICSSHSPGRKQLIGNEKQLRCQGAVDDETHPDGRVPEGILG